MEGFDIAWLFGVLAERFPDLPNTEIEATLEIDKGPGVPNLSPDFLSRDDPTGLRSQQSEYFEGLRLERKTCLSHSQLAARGVQYEAVEAKQS